MVPDGHTPPPAGEVVSAAVVKVTDRRRAGEALHERLDEFQAAFDQAVIPMSQTNCETRTFTRVNAAFCRLVGRSAEELLGLSVADVTHPDDREDDAAGYWRMVHGETAAHEMEKRFVRPDGSVRWARIVVSPVHGADGRPVRTVAVVEDVTERRYAEQQRLLLSRELNHRARNALAVVLAALRLTPKESAEGYAAAVEGRVMALARAHDLLATGRWSGVDLRTLITGELKPFLTAREGLREGDLELIELKGAPCALGPTAAQAFSMVLHELATNALKHGALSIVRGRLTLSWASDVDRSVLRFVWAEHGGPPVNAPPRHRGFGSRVIERTIRGQLAGQLRQYWLPSGLVCKVEVPLARIAAP